MERAGFKMDSFFFFSKLILGLINCPASVFPTCSMCVDTTYDSGQRKPSLEKNQQPQTGNLRGVCQKPEFSDDEWCERVMQEAGIYFSLFSHLAKNRTLMTL